MTLRSAISVLVLSLSLLSQAAFAAPDSVNVNAADAETLAAVLDGVGLVRAEAIVAYRQENGRFDDVYDLANVKGIGDRTIELNEGRIRLTD
jgi:competence protein ComEA